MWLLALKYGKEYWDEALLVVVVAVVLGYAGVKTLQVSALRVDLAEAKQQASDLQARSERLAREVTDLKVKNLAAHAAGQQEKEKEYAQALQQQAAARAADRHELSRLRNTIHAYARGTASGGSATAAPVSDQDRLDRLADLLDEGVELAQEGRGVVERRDAEVKRLLDQIGLDRSVCEVRPQTDPVAAPIAQH